jgi:hypothetical protein
MPEPDETRERIRQWTARIEAEGFDARPMPEWWDWAVAAAQYHLPTCDWIKTGVSSGHCSCALTRVIARIIQEARR